MSQLIKQSAETQSSLALQSCINALCWVEKQLCASGGIHWVSHFRQCTSEYIPISPVAVYLKFVSNSRDCLLALWNKCQSVPLSISWSLFLLIPPFCSCRPELELHLLSALLLHVKKFPINNFCSKCHKPQLSLETRRDNSGKSSHFEE